MRLNFALDNRLIKNKNLVIIFSIIFCFMDLQIYAAAKPFPGFDK